MGLSSPSEGDHTKQEQNPFKRKADRATLWLRPRSVPEQARSLCGVMNPLCDSEEDVHMHGLFPAGVEELCPDQRQEDGQADHRGLWSLW